MQGGDDNLCTSPLLSHQFVALLKQRSPAPQQLSGIESISSAYLCCGAFFKLCGVRDMSVLRRHSMAMVAMIATWPGARPRFYTASAPSQ